MKRDYWPTAHWRSASPATLKIIPEKLMELDRIIESEYDNLNGIVVIRRGYIVFEKYYNGYGPEDTHHMTSVTKSVVSALIGIAIDSGYIESVDQRVLDFFPEYDFNISDNKKEITLRRLLTMTAPYPFEDWREPLDKLCMQPDWIKYTLDMIGEGGKIGAFKYSTAGAHLLSAILTRSTGKSAREFANENLFGPIGMKEIPDYEMKVFGFEDLFGKNVRGWVKDPDNISTGGWGLTLTPRDMARFGFLYLNHGNWDNNQIISNAWISESTTPHSGISINNTALKYGYLWWIHEDNKIFAYSAEGDGSNVICCVPCKDLVVAIVSEFTANSRKRGTLIEDFIIPAMID
jgi:CubicO group peptidase (beta-lactamase class C family)